MPNPFAPIRYLSLARELAAGTTDECKLRAAVGRAYYAVFLLARSVVNVLPVDRGVHEKVKQRLTSQNIVIGFTYGSLLELRVEADYHLTANDPGNADWALNWSNAEKYAADIVDYLEKQQNRQ
jgi:hypothetical protein